MKRGVESARRGFGRGRAQLEEAGALEHRVQPRVAAKREARAAPHELRREAQEEEHVAHALLGDEREFAPGEVEGERGRGRIGRARGHALRHEAPAIFVPRRVEVPAREERPGEILARDREIAEIARDRLAIGVDRFVPAALGFQRERHVAVHVDPVRIDVEGRLELRDRFLAARRVAKEEAEVVVEVGDTRGVARLSRIRFGSA